MATRRVCVVGGLSWVVLAGTAMLVTPRAAAAPVVAIYSVNLTVETPTAATPWVAVANGGSIAYYQRSVTYSQALQVATAPVTFASEWDRFWATGGVVGPVAVVAPPVVTFTSTESVLGSRIVPPAAALPAVVTTRRTDPPPTHDPAFYFGAAADATVMPPLDPAASFGAQLALTGNGYSTAAGHFDSMLSDFIATDDPYGVKSSFQPTFTGLAGDLHAIASLLLGGVPTNASAFWSFAAHLNGFATQLALLPQGSGYLPGIPVLQSLASAAADGAGRIQAGLSGDDSIHFLHDLGLMSTRMLDFDQAVTLPLAPVPEPAAWQLLLAGLAALGAAVTRPTRAPSPPGWRAA